MQYDLHTTRPLISTKIVFFDIDGVLTPSADFTPGVSPNITKESVEILKKFAEKYSVIKMMCKLGNRILHE